MSNRAKLLLSVLFIAAIILTIGLTRFYFDVTKNNVKITTDDKVESILDTFGDMQSFRNVNGFCGVINEEGTVVIEPEWLEVLDVTSDLVLVSRRMNDAVRIGGIDYEENVVLPFVYESFTPLGEQYYAAKVGEDGSYLIYNSDYSMAFASNYDNAALNGNMLELTAEGCRFSYSMEKELRRAEMQCRIGSQTMSWRVSNQVYLTDLREKDLKRINRGIAAYMSMLLEDEFSDLMSISSAEFIGGLSKPGSMPGALIDRISGFSMVRNADDPMIYTLAFTAAYHNKGELDSSQSVRTELSFRRSADNDMLLTSANLDFQRQDQTPSAPKPLPTEETEEPEKIVETEAASQAEEHLHSDEPEDVDEE